jgi:signal transduction histidine kinase
MATTPREALVPEDLEGVIEKIFSDLADSLESRSSPLVRERILDPGLAAQARSIIAETISGPSDEAPPPVTVDYADAPSLHAHGRAAGLRDVDPAEPLMAAELLFHHALPVLAEYLGASRDPIGVARDLHHAIWRRFPPGAIAYVEVLRERLASAYAESRRRMSRDLHDRIAPELAIVRQHIELVVRDRPADGLDAALAGLETSLREVQSLAFDLRESAEEGDIDGAIRAYIARAPGSPPVHFGRRGDARPVPAKVAEEAVAIMIESIRNARRHAHEATTIAVTIEWDEDALRLAVRDDGAGSAPGSAGTSLGLAGMSERAAAIGARVEFDSGARGASVVLSVPYLIAAS